MRKLHRKHRTVKAGTISGVEDHGTIIIVRLKTEQGWDVPVFFDHRPFTWMLESEGISVEKLCGRRASYDGEVLNFSK